MKRYRVDFYDMMDGWIGSNQHEFDDFEEAKKYALEQQSELGEDSKHCGEHYGVIDLKVGIEIFCCQEYL